MDNCRLPATTATTSQLFSQQRDLTGPEHQVVLTCRMRKKHLAFILNLRGHFCLVFLLLWLVKKTILGGQNFTSPDSSSLSVYLGPNIDNNYCLIGSLLETTLETLFYLHLEDVVLLPFLPVAFLEIIIRIITKAVNIKLRMDKGPRCRETA